MDERAYQYHALQQQWVSMRDFIEYWLVYIHIQYRLPAKFLTAMLQEMHIADRYIHACHKESTITSAGITIGKETVLFTPMDIEETSQQIKF